MRDLCNGTSRDVDRVPGAGRVAIGNQTIPDVVHEFAAGRDVTLSWRNIRGGLTFQFADRFIKWNPRSTGIDLDRERQRLEWIAPRHRAPRVVEFGQDDAMSLDRNFGEGHQHELFEAYGIEPDQERIRYYRGLYRLAS